MDVLKNSGCSENFINNRFKTFFENKQNFTKNDSCA